MMDAIGFNGFLLQNGMKCMKVSNHTKPNLVIAMCVKILQRKSKPWALGEVSVFSLQTVKTREEIYTDKEQKNAKLECIGFEWV